MATTIRDFIEMGIEELTWLYKAIHKNPANRKYGHDIPTLNLMREVIIQKCTGELYNSYCDIVKCVDGSKYESSNSIPLSRSECMRIYRNREDYGITTELVVKDFNSKINDELKTVDFLEEQETDLEYEKNVKDDILKEREEYLNNVFDSGMITSEEKNELNQIRLLK